MNIVPGLSEILEPLFKKHGLTLNRQFDVVSDRTHKRGMPMKTWTSEYAAVFVYADNTVGVRKGWYDEVEQDLNAAEPDFCSKLEVWLTDTKKVREALIRGIKHDSV